jgi:predicted acyltransferase (DUF342 family)
MSPDKFGPPTGGQNSLSVSTIGGDLTITGNITSKGEIQLDGHVHGDVDCVALVLGENSNVEGNVTADDVVIRGRLIGSVRAFTGDVAVHVRTATGGPKPREAQKETGRGLRTIPTRAE